MKNTKKAVLLAAALVAGGAVLGSAAYFAGHALTPLVGAAQEYERTFVLAYENCTIVTNPSASNFGAITHVAPDGAVLEMQAAGPMGTVLPGDEAADTLTTMESGGIIYNTTYIREMAALKVVYGTGTTGKLTLSVSRDGKGWYEVGEMENNVTYGEWTYAPHYFKIEATGHVVLRGAFISADCGEDYAETIDHSLQGTYKGSLTVTDYAYTSAYEQVIPDVTVVVEKDKVNFHTVSPDSSMDIVLEDLVLYPVGNDGFSSTYYLAEDYNDPNPAETATIGTQYSALAISYTDASGAVMVDFSGYKFVDATDLTVTKDGVEVTETIVLDEGDEIQLEADAEPHNCTEDILWSVEDTSVVGFDYTGNSDNAEGERVILLANGGGEAAITVVCGSITKTINVSVNAFQGTTGATIPEALIGTTWYSYEVGDGYGMYIDFDSETEITCYDEYDINWSSGEEVSVIDSEASTVEGDIYTLVFPGENGWVARDLVLVYDATNGTLMIESGKIAYSSYSDIVMEKA